MGWAITRDQNPSQPYLQSQMTWPKKQIPIPTPHPEVTRQVTAAAQKAADDLNVNVFPRKSNYTEELNTFFTFPIQSSETSLASTHYEDWTPPSQKTVVRDINRSLIVDSGASLHMVAREKLTPYEKESIKPMAKPIVLQTVNGPVIARNEATVYILDLDDSVTAVLMDKAPPVLSLGKLCIENGWAYQWKPGSLAPVLTKGSKTIECHVTHNVPNIQVSRMTPATDAGGESERTQPQRQETIHADRDVKQTPVSTQEEDKAGGDSTHGEAIHNELTHFPKDARM